MQLRTEIEISAPPARVFDILTDFPRYPEWNPFITSLEGKARVGARLELRLSLPEGRDHVFRPEVLAVEPNRALRWRGRLFSPFIFEGEHYFELQPTPAGEVRLVHGENFRGVLLPLLGTTLTRTIRGFVYMNTALKKRAESSL